MRRYSRSSKAFWTFIILCVFSCFLSYIHPEPIAARTNEPLVGRVIQVADGDTITLLTDKNEKIRVRFQGIDAPERDQNFGEASREVLKNLVFGKKVRVEVEKTDRYGRTVGRVWLEDSENLGDLDSLNSLNDSGNSGDSDNLGDLKISESLADSEDLENSNDSKKSKKSKKLEISKKSKKSKEIKGLDVEETMLREGMAWHYSYFNQEKKLAQAQREAQAEKRGLWTQPNAIPPWKWRRLPKKENSSSL